MTSEESNRWFLTETKTLIAIWGEENVQNMFDGTIRDSEVYKLIAKRLNDKGFKRSVSQVKTKVKSLKKEYRKAKDSLNTDGSRGKIKFVHFDVMNKIMGDKTYCQPSGIAKSFIPDINLCASTSIEVIDFTPSQSELENITIKQEDPDSEAEEAAAEEAAAETPSSTSETPIINKKLPSKRKRISIKEFVKTSITHSVDKFISLEKELDERHLKQNLKFQEQLLELEREKIELLKSFLEK